MPDAFELVRDPRGSVVHVRRRPDGARIGCIEAGLYEIVRRLVLADASEPPRGEAGLDFHNLSGRWPRCRRLPFRSERCMAMPTKPPSPRAFKRRREMPLENRNLEPGTTLVARYKKAERICEVVQTDDGVRFRLDDGTEHRSPS